MRRLAGIVFGLALATSAAPACEKKVALHSASYHNFGALLHGVSSKPVVVAADFEIPAGKAAHYPAVIIVHTIAGYHEKNEGWFATQLRKAAFATLTYDSFAARHLGNVTKGGDPSLTPRRWQTLMPV